MAIINPKLAPHHVDIKPHQKAFICRCGSSNNFPYCDGSHKTLNRDNQTSIVNQIIEGGDSGKSIYVCGCGYSANESGFCDGSHSKLSASQKEMIISRSKEYSSRLDGVITSSQIHVPKQLISVSNPQAAPHGVSLAPSESAFLCSCGQSKNFPRCDGSHKSFNKENNTSFAPRRFDGGDVGQVVYYCGCGYSSNNDPKGSNTGLCDNSHSKLTVLEKDELIRRAEKFALANPIVVKGFYFF